MTRVAFQGHLDLAQHWVCAKLPDVTDARTPPEPLPKKSATASSPKPLPEVGSSGDVDNTWRQSPAAAFPTNAQYAQGEQTPTIGHIGRYALKYKIGEGGLGTVYAAHDPLLTRLIAVKTLNVELDVSERDAFNSLFLNEARAAGGLSHPNIVTVFDAGISDSRVYIAMELLKGRDLRQLRQEGWRATPSEAALIVRRVADALAYAHSKGVVHRDIKPANIFMVGRAQPRVLDFGIARVAHQHEAGASGEVAAGSPYYMSPEQARFETVDRRADVFSLGVVLYELLTDLKPFRGTTLSEITNAVLKHDPPLANKIDPNIPEGLAQITARAIEKNPDNRYRSARAFSRELRHWLDENAVSSEDELPAVVPSRSRPRWLMAGGAGLVTAGVVITGAFAWIRWSPEHLVKPEVATAVTPATVAAAPTTTLIASAPVTVAIADAPVAAAVVDARETPSAPAVAVAPAVPDVAAPELVASAPASTGSDPAAAKAVASTAPQAPKESQKDKRLREARAREAARASLSPAAALPTGLVRIAVSPWGEIEVDGRAFGTSPPINELTLPEGRHQIVIRNTDFPAMSTNVVVTSGQPVSIKHKF